MKNRMKIFGVVALAIIIEFGITACYDDFENKELKTNGRLTITGLNGYEGKEIFLISNNADDSVLFACGYIEEQFFNGVRVDNYTHLCPIANGQASLKVYLLKYYSSFSDYYYSFNHISYEGNGESYNGNDKGVYFDVYLCELNTYNATGTSRIGYVIVDFTNGVGTGAFCNKNQPVNLEDIGGATIIDKAVNYVNSSSDSNLHYVLYLDNDVILTANTSRILNNTDTSLTIISNNKECRIILLSAGSIFTVKNGGLYLGSNITLVGYSSNNSPVVNVTGGSFHMDDYSKITGNNSSTNGGGVCVNGGDFEMGGGTISGNTSKANGGGVYVNSGSFHMGDLSKITGNTSNANGGGVYVSDNGSFYMSGGTVYGSNEQSSLANTASRGAALGRASANSVTLRNDYYSYDYSYHTIYHGSDILPHTDGQLLYTNNTIEGRE